jgi:hypothetical protein
MKEEGRKRREKKGMNTLTVTLTAVGGAGWLPVRPL